MVFNGKIHFECFRPQLRLVKICQYQSEYVMQRKITINGVGLHPINGAEKNSLDSLNSGSTVKVIYDMHELNSI